MTSNPKLADEMCNLLAGTADCRMMVSELNMNNVSIRSIITTDLGKRKICVKFVTNNLHDEEKFR
jgi:hypothetical protein